MRPDSRDPILLLSSGSSGAQHVAPEESLLENVRTLARRIHAFSEAIVDDPELGVLFARRAAVESLLSTRPLGRERGRISEDELAAAAAHITTADERAVLESLRARISDRIRDMADAALGIVRD